jgi:hypothetical protein
MANYTGAIGFSSLPAGGALSGKEIVPVDQNGITVKITAQQIANKVVSDINIDPNILPGLNAILSQKLDLSQTKAVIDTSINSAFAGVVNGDKGSIDLSSPSPTVSGIYTPSVSGTYTNWSGLAADLTVGAVKFIVNPDSSITKVEYPIPLSSYATKTVVDPVVSAVNGGDTILSPSGDMHTSAGGYVSIWASPARTFWNNNPFPKGGNLKEIRIWCVTAGAVSIRMAHVSSTSLTVYNQAITLICVLGYNSFVVNTHFTPLAITAGDFGGLYQSSAGKVGYKTKTAGAYFVDGSISSTSGTVTAGATNLEFGIEFVISDAGLIAKTDNLNTIVLNSDPSNVTSFLKTASLTMVADAANNVFTSGTIVTPALVKNDGTLATTAGWATWEALFSAGAHSVIYVSGINARPGNPSALYWRFVDSGGVVLSFGSYTAGTAFNLAVPALAVKFTIDIMAAGDSTAVYANAVISYVGIITKIAGNSIAGTGGGGTAYDQDLYKHSSVEFAGITTPALNIIGLPTTRSGASIGGAYIDLTSEALKVRLS